MALRGPAASSHLPKTAADRPRKTMAMLKIQPIVGRSPVLARRPARVMPMSRVRGRLKTLKA